MFLRTGFSLSPYVNCAFDPSSYRKHVLACWQWDWMFRAFCYKKIATSFFASEYPFLSLIVAKIRFLHVGNKIALLWVLYHKKKKGFCFFLLLKRVGFGFLEQKPCFGWFAVILGCFHCYCTKKRSSLFSVSVTKLHFGRSILLKNMLWFVCRKIVSSDIAPEKCFLPVCIESLWFLLDFTQNKRFCLFSGKLRCFQDSCLEERPLPFFVHKLRC